MAISLMFFFLSLLIKLTIKSKYAMQETCMTEILIALTTDVSPSDYSTVKGLFYLLNFIYPHPF